MVLEFCDVVAKVGKGAEGEGDSKQESLDYPCLGFDVFLCFQKMQIRA